MNKETHNYRLEKIEEFISSVYDEEKPIMYYEVKVEDDDEALITTDGIRIIIPEMGVSVRTGEYCRYDEDEEYYMPDFSITLIYEENETDPSKHIYWEQDSINVSLYNYLRNRDLSMGEIESLNCDVELELQ